MRSSYSAFRRHRQRCGLALILLVTLIACTAILDLGVGARFIGPATVFQALTDYQPTVFSHHIIVNLRLVRVVAALLVGAALGVAGALLQSVIRNPLGEPHILGLNAGAAFAVVVCTTLGSHWVSSPELRPLVAALGAAVLFSLVLAFSSAGRSGLTVVKVTLCGVALSAFASSLTATVLLLDEQTMTEIRTWLTGDLSALSWPVITVAALMSGIALLLALSQAASLNALALGDRMALGLGVSLRRTRVVTIIAIALLSGAAVSVAGPIGFVGLIVPVIVRRLITEDLRIAIPCCALTGALMMLLADIAARTLLAPQEMATGIMTALVGAPLFIAIAVRVFK